MGKRIELLQQQQQQQQQVYSVLPFCTGVTDYNNNKQIGRAHV